MAKKIETPEKKRYKISRQINFDTDLYNDILVFAKKENRSFHNATITLIDYALRHLAKQY